MATTIAGIAVIAAFIVLFGNDAKTDSKAPPQRPTKQAETGMANPRVAGVRNWADAIAGHDLEMLDAHSDYAELYKHMRMGEDYFNVEPAQVRTRLIEGAEAKWFRLFETTAAEIEGLSQGMATASQGQVMLHLSPRQEQAQTYEGSMDIAVDFYMLGNSLRVQRWTIRKEGPLLVPEKSAKPTRGFHPKIGPSKTIDVLVNGVETERPVADPQALDHLDSTAPELRLTIDRHIQTMAKIGAAAHPYDEARQALVGIGKPAVPRLLNALYEIPMDSQDNLVRIRRVIGVLRRITRLHFTFDHAALGSDPFTGGTQETRVLTLRSWFGWWTDKHRGSADQALQATREAAAAEPRTDQQSRRRQPKRR